MSRIKHLLVPYGLLTAALVLAAILLYLFTPDRVNLLALLLARFAILALGTGAVVLVLAQRRLRPTGPVLLATLSAWVLLPLIAGPWMEDWAVDRLMNYYHSADFRHVSSAWQGIKIELLDQKFGFTTTKPRGPMEDGPAFTPNEVLPAGLRRCWVNGYIATYRIEAQHDLQLTFALAAQEDTEFFSGGDQAVRSIQKAFEQVGAGHAEDAAWHGLFRVPRGSHTLVVRGERPFLLQVYGTQALWTPDLVLAGYRRYAPLYADTFSRAELEAAAEPALPVTCAPLGCPNDAGGILGKADAVAIKESATIGAVAGERPLDWQGNGRYDALELDVTLNIRLTGEYSLIGTLSSRNGRELAEATYESAAYEPLCRGERTVKLIFSGDDLAHSGFHGPYTLSELRLGYIHARGYYPREVDIVHDAYQTDAYSVYEFDR